MKNYLKFSFSAKQLLPYWLLFYLLGIIPYFSLIVSLRDMEKGAQLPVYYFPVLLLFIIVAFLFSFYINKICIESTSYKDKSLAFGGNLGTYIGKMLLGTLLSVITLGIYSAWFARDLQRFFVDNTSYNSSVFKFNGKAGKLFLIITLGVILPCIVVFGFMVFKLVKSGNAAPLDMFQDVLLFELIFFFLLIPYIYLAYKWMMDMTYKNFTISWKTTFWSACGKIALEMFLTLITVGIYYPLAWIKLYKYFVDRTVATSDERTLEFGYDIEPASDFLFVWGQSLLSIITLGIYYPWSCSKIYGCILGKTFIVEKADN